ncbi:MAG: hypothetical protein HW390_932, partial [Candidatus Brocadiaceae bacterium]|nr:hypothetical protein [Candidatus Brocadiaceae bacterium]
MILINKLTLKTQSRQFLNKQQEGGFFCVGQRLKSAAQFYRVRCIDLLYGFFNFNILACDDSN